MTHEARQLQLMRDILRFVPDEHQREAGDVLLMLIADVRREATFGKYSHYQMLGHKLFTDQKSRTSK